MHFFVTNWEYIFARFYQKLYTITYRRIYYAENDSKVNES